MACGFAFACPLQRSMFRVLVFASVAVTLGCGGSSATKEDTKRLVDLVTEVADGISTKQGMAEIFATSAVVPQKKAEQEQYFSKQFYTTKKEIRVNGDTATISVHVADRTGNLLGDVEWTALRENGRWKLSSIPLP